MKLHKKKKKFGEDRPSKKKKSNPMRKHSDDDEDDDDDDSSEGGGVGDWMIRGREERNKAQKRQETEQKNNRRPPELYLVGDGDSKVARFITNEPLASIWRYSCRVNGQWRTFTAPPTGEKDLFKKSGLRPQLKHVYVVIDRTGYVDKKTKKKIKNSPRYFVANGRQEKSLETIREKRGKLTKRDLEIVRSGTGTDTTYSFIPDDKSSMPEEFLKSAKPLLSLKEFAQYYRPPTLDEQKAILSGVTPADDDDDRPKKRRRDDDEAF